MAVGWHDSKVDSPKYISRSQQEIQDTPPTFTYPIGALRASQ